MPAPLPASATLGALLRLVEQEKTKSPTEQIPGAGPSDPGRLAVQAPLETPIAPESPESSRVLSLKSEGGLTPSGEDAGPVIPTTAKVGPIGGAEEGMGSVPITEIPTGQIPQATPTPQPTLSEYLAKGKTAAQWYAETGRQSELDKIGAEASKGGIGNFNEFLNTGQPANPQLAIDPITGQSYQKPPEQGQPNTATLQDYLNQGKTAEQWYAETGRQSELNQLTRGATQPIPADVQAGFSRGIVPVIGEGGAYTIPTTTQGQPQLSTSEFVGPMKAGETRGMTTELRPQMTPEAAYRPEGFIGPMKPDLAPELMNSYTMPTSAPTPTPPAGAAGELMKKLDAASTDKERDEIVKQFMIQQGLGNYIPQPTPTPTPRK